MKQTIKKILSFMLAWCMVISTMPIGAIEVHATDTECTHQWQYTLSEAGDTITAKCVTEGDASCEYKETGVTLQVSVMAATMHYGAADRKATVEDLLSAVTGAEISKLRYRGTGDTQYSGASVPSDIGTYEAYVTLTDGDTKLTAKAPFTLVEGREYVYTDSDGNKDGFAFTKSIADLSELTAMETSTATQGYFLSEDITLTETLQMAGSGADSMFYLDLNGHAITMTGEAGSVITVNDCTLNLFDTSAEQTGKITGGKGTANSSGTLEGGGVLIGNDTAATGEDVFNLYGGDIEGNTAGDGAGIYVAEGATLEQYGGKITGNTSTGDAGGVRSFGTYIMYSGEVSHNTAGGNCGGIANGGNATSSFTMYDGSISNNTANGTTGGGGIYNLGTSKMDIYGGEISGNTAAASGSGIFSRAGTHTIENCQLTGNTRRYTGGYGGAIYIDGGKITITDSTISDNSASYGGGVCNHGTAIITNSTISDNSAGYGGGVYNGNSSTATITDSTINDNSATEWGGGVYTSNYSTATITGSTIDGNSASHGGGVYNRHNVTVTIAGGIINDNSAKLSGGGVCNCSSSTATITDSTIDGNSAFYGGGVYNDIISTATITDSTISGNSAFYGGGVYNAISSTATIADSTINDNSATKNGGGVYNNGKLKLSGGSVIYSNKAGEAGEANNLHLNADSTVTVTGALTDDAKIGITPEGDGLSISGFGTYNSGEAIENYFSMDANTHRLTLDDDGAILLTAHAHNWGTPENKGDRLVYTCTDAEDGLLCAYADMELEIKLTPEVAEKLADGTAVTASVTNDVEALFPDVTVGEVKYYQSGSDTPLDAAPSAIGIYEARADIVVSAENTQTIKATFEIIGGHDYTYVDYTYTDSLEETEKEIRFGNAIGTADELLALTGSEKACTADRAYYLTGDIEIPSTWNIAGGEFYLDLNGYAITLTADTGSVIHIADDGILNLFDTNTSQAGNGKITGGKGYLDGVNEGKTNGGGIYNVGTLNLYGGAITGNAADNDAGGVMNYGTFNMYGGEISYNTALHGAGVYNQAEYSVINVYDGLITENDASVLAGGLFTLNGGPVNIHGGEISHNEAPNGAGMTIRGKNVKGQICLTMTGGIITENTATKYGGGIRFENLQDARISGGKIHKNTAAHGGGIYGASSADANIYISDTEITENEANKKNGHGGGIFSYETNLHLYAGTLIDGNKGYRGGGVQGSQTIAVYEGAVISNNEATQDGGGVYLGGYGGWGGLLMNGGAIHTNVAKYGGGVYIASEIKYYGSINGEIYNNTATGNGGGIWTCARSEGNALTVTGKLYGNTAADYGGGIAHSGGNTLIIADGAEIYENKATHGAGINSDGSLQLTGGAVTGNIASETAGGVRASCATSISGNPVVAENFVEIDGVRTPSNLYIISGKTLAVTGELTEGTDLGITIEDASVSLTGFEEYNSGVDIDDLISMDDSSAGSLVTDENGNVSVVTHEHIWAYTAVDNVLTAKCATDDGVDCGHREATTLTVTAEDKVYDGNRTTASYAGDLPTVTGDQITINYAGAGETVYSTCSKAPVNAGTYKAMVTLGDATAEMEFEITAKSLSADMLTLVDTYTYSGIAIQAKYEVADGDNILEEGKDFDLDTTGDSTASQPGEYQLKIKGVGNYTGTVQKTWNIEKANITVNAIDSRVTYDGKAYGIYVNPYISGAVVRYAEGQVAPAADSGYSLAESPVYTEPGTYTVFYMVSAGGNYNNCYGSCVVDIDHKQINAETTTVEIADAGIYDGSEKKPAVTVSYKGEVLKEERDYRIAYSSNTNAGDGTVTVTGTGYYEGSIGKTFAIKADDLTARSITLEYDEVEYDGSAKKPAVTVQGVDAAEYTVAYGENTAIGEGTVTITGNGNYIGTVEIAFNITAIDISKTEAVLSFAEDVALVYDGNAKTPEAVTVKDGDKELVYGEDYTVTYSNTTDAGTATARIEGQGIYGGSKEVTYTIAPQTLDANGVVLSATAFTYTGKAQTPTVNVSAGDERLVAGTDYTVSYSAGRTNAGTYTVKVIGKGNYTGTVSKTYTIAAQSAAGAKVSLSVAKYVYDGKAKKPTVTVKLGTLKLKAGTDYTVSYASGRTKVGTYKVTVKFKGNYTGSSKSASFVINPKATKIKSLTGAKKALTVKWNKVSKQATGYEIMLATNNKFTKGKKTVKVTSYKTVSKKITKLTAKKKYYVKVRTYKTVSGKTYYSAWSGVKSAKTK